MNTETRPNDVFGGLGGSDDNMEVEIGGNIEIHGGNLDLYGGNDCAAIGGNYKQSVGDISIFDGHIKVLGGDASAGIWAGSIGSNDSEKFGTLNIGNGVKTMTYNYNENYWETVKVVNHPVTFVHERRKAVLFTCDHAGYTAETCPYCKHD